MNTSLKEVWDKDTPIHNPFQLSTGNTKGIIYGSRQQYLAYPDDMVLMARSRKEIEKAFMWLEEMARKYGLTINEQKSKHMVMMDNDEREKMDIVLNGERNGKFK